MHFNQPIAEIEQSLQSVESSPGGSFKVNHHPSTEKKLMHAMSTDLKPVLSVGPGQITKILTAVPLALPLKRNPVRESSWELESSYVQQVVL